MRVIAGFMLASVLASSAALAEEPDNKQQLAIWDSKCGPALSYGAVDGKDG